MHSIQYASSRSEVWRWYWRAWAKPNGLWLFHVAFGVLFAASFTFSAHEPFNIIRFILIVVLVTVACMVLFPLWPQIRFKPSMRSLSIDPSGISTTIGKLSASRDWNEVNSIVDNNEEIVIVGKNRNAFIIPKRAFQSDAARQEFLRDATHWHQKSAA
jgi:hypothetical protein